MSRRNLKRHRIDLNLGLEDAAAEMARMAQVEAARKEQESISEEAEVNMITQKMFRVI